MARPGDGDRNAPGRCAARAIASRKFAVIAIEPYSGLGFAAAGIVIHPLAHFETLFGAPLLCGDPAVEKAHIALGKGAHMRVGIIEPVPTVPEASRRYPAWCLRIVSKSGAALLEFSRPEWGPWWGLCPAGCEVLQGDLC